MPRIYFRFLIVLCWIIRGGSLFNNIIGICITISALSLMRAQSLKVIVVAFCLLFFYDIFWVFFSESFFGKNVMVTVAQQNFTEPVKASTLLVLSFHVVSASLGGNVSSSYHLDFPVFLHYPYLVISRGNWCSQRWEGRMCSIWDWAISSFRDCSSSSSLSISIQSGSCSFGSILGCRKEDTFVLNDVEAGSLAEMSDRTGDEESKKLIDQGLNLYLPPSRIRGTV